MQTPEFRENLENLIEFAGQTSTAIMCAEAVPWRCHRSLIADALVVRGIQVVEILSAKQSQAPCADAFRPGRRVVDVTYPAAAANASGNLKLEFDGA